MVNETWGIKQGIVIKPVNTDRNEGYVDSNIADDLAELEAIFGD